MPRPTCLAFIVALLLEVLAIHEVSAFDAQEVVRRTGITRGVAVVISDQIEGSLQLAETGQFVVHQLVLDSGNVAALRSEVMRKDLGGRVVIDELHDTLKLPYGDGFVNLLIVDPPDRVVDSESQRVLTVRGAKVTVEKGKLAISRKVASDQLDDWTHRWYDATGNCVSHDRRAAFPQMVQWQHGPALEDGTADGKIPRIWQGYWILVDSSSGDLICRDAGNGTLLWRKPMGLTDRDDPAVADGRVYVYFDAEATDEQRQRNRGGLGPLVAIDVASGNIVQTYDESLPGGTAESIEFLQTDQDRQRRETPVPWFVVGDDIIVQAYANDLVVLERDSGMRRWSKKIDGATWFSPAIAPRDDAGHVVLAAEAVWPARRGRHDGSGNVRAVSAFDAETSQLLWRNENVHPERPIEEKGRRYFSRAEFKPVSVANSLVLLHTSSYQFRQGGSIAVLDLATGKQLWRHAFDPKERYTQGSQRAVLRAGEVIVMDGLGALRFDAETGKPLGEPLDNRQNIKREARANAACTASRATLDWLICNAYLFVGPDGKPQPQFATRGACGQGVIPANGMIYVPPTPCDCGDYLRGHIALAPQMAGSPIKDGQRLEKGPAYGESVGEIASGQSVWTSFLGGPQRRSSSPASLPHELQVVWTRELTKPRSDAVNSDRRNSERYLGVLGAPVIGKSAVVVPLPENHQVAALDPVTGKEQWRYQAGGKVDSPPTIAGSLAVFGCDDGCVYALRMSDGQLVWRFRGAPIDAVSLQHGHLSSAFPLPGSTLVLGDAVVAVAGQHTDLGGLHCWVLDLETGRPRAQRVIESDQPRVVTTGVTVADEDGKGFWIGKQLHLSLKLEDLAAHPYDGPRPPIAFDRNGTRIRFRTNEARGGSTHSWKGAMSVPGRNRLLRAHRLAIGEELAFGLIDPTPRQRNSRMLWCTALEDDGSAARWSLTAEELGGQESYGAMLVSKDRLYVAGGSRDGKAGVLQIVDTRSGKLLSTMELSARVTECGLATDGTRLFIACEDGTLHCFGAQ